MTVAPEDADAYTNNLTVSNIVLINGQNITNFIALYQLSDPDASYNAMFRNVGQAPARESAFHFSLGLEAFQVEGNREPANVLHM